VARASAPSPGRRAASSCVRILCKARLRAYTGDGPRVPGRVVEGLIVPRPALPSGIRVTYRQQYRRCGKATCSRCAAGGPAHGPYWYAYWWEGGRTRSCYIGKQAPADVAGTIDSSPVTPVSPAPAPAPAGAPLRVQTLGRFAVWRGEEAIPPAAWTSRRAATLFKCVVSAPGQRRFRWVLLRWMKSLR